MACTGGKKLGAAAERRVKWGERENMALQDVLPFSQKGGRAACSGRATMQGGGTHSEHEYSTLLLSSMYLYHEASYLTPYLVNL